MYLDEKSYTSPPVETKPDIFALPTLIAWLEKQPANREYDFCDCEGNCLLGQYMTAHGIKWYREGGPGGLNPYSQLAERTGWGASVALRRPQTFGAALARARALLP